jgi:hypothetical protein
MRFQVEATQRKPRVFSARLVVASLPGSLSQSSAGCPEGFAQCTVQKVGTGSFRLDFNTAFARVPQVNITPLHATLSLKPVLTTRSATSLTWLVKNDAGAATDPTEMDIIVLGCDTADQI